MNVIAHNYGFLDFKFRQLESLIVVAQQKIIDKHLVHCMTCECVIWWTKTCLCDGTVAGHQVLNMMPASLHLVVYALYMYVCVSGMYV